VSLLLQSILVAIAVGACALYSAWRLLPTRLRLRVLAALERLPGAVTAPWLARLRSRTLAQLAGGCSGCAAGGAPSGAATPGAPSPNRTPGALRR
jgi:hypothetical protein